MSKAGGLFLILGGLAIAAYGIASDNDASESKAEGEIGLAKNSQADERPIPNVAALARTTTRATKPVAAFATPVVVTITQRLSEPPATSPRAAEIPKDRDTLARELQKELKRVGCYEGELNGIWTPATRRAMKAFTDRVNATLPVHQPDAILFAMVQGHQDKVCGKPCPSGQGLSDEGRCLPNVILAKGFKKGPPAPAIAGWSTVTTASAAAPTPAFPSVAGPSPAEGRMALDGPTEPPLQSARTPTTRRAPVARRTSPPPPRAAMRQGSQASSWVRSMQARRFDSLF
jgi:putative peptidoglycan binding protein